MIDQALLTYITVGIGFTTTLIYFNANTFYNTSPISYVDASTQTSTPQRNYKSCSTQTPINWKNATPDQKVASPRNDGWYDILHTLSNNN